MTQGGFSSDLTFRVGSQPLSVNFQVTSHTEGASQAEADTWQPSSQNWVHLRGFVGSGCVFNNKSSPTFKNHEFSRKNKSGFLASFGKSEGLAKHPMFPNGSILAELRSCALSWDTCFPDRCHLHWACFRL